jgi:glycosyltransferase involved in cell wall biosynthesis
MLLDKGIQCEYQIIGEGEARSELEYTIRELQIEPYVKMEGAKQPIGVANAMDLADLFLLPSVREDFGTVLVEAQAAGLPIVASKVGGTAEATRDGVTSILVPPRNPQAMCDAISNLVQDKKRYQSMSEAGPNHAKQFCNEQIGNQLLSFYKSVMGSHRLDRRPAPLPKVK